MTSSGIVTTQLSTPLGRMTAKASARGICLLKFTDQNITAKHNINPDYNSFLQQLYTELQEYFAGTRTVFTVPLDIQGTPFQKTAWQILQTIPYGTTISYQEQAIAIHNPRAVQAVAQANKNNRIAIIIPCHRVIGKNGTMTGYGGGIRRKEFLLQLEKGLDPKI